MGDPPEHRDPFFASCMIPAAELRRAAAASGVEPARLDLDYTLGWILLGLWKQPNVPGIWVFKGGTCLRKCYFPEYRFSEDLDFTLKHSISMESGQAVVAAAARSVQEATGIDFTAQPLRADVMPVEEGDPGFRLRLYYRGSLPMGGSPRSIQIHLSTQEVLTTLPEAKALRHPYSDSGELGAVKLECYSLVEVLAEKLRAICGQRRFPIARDLYDVHEIIRRGTDARRAVAILPAKLRLKHLELPKDLVGRLEERRAEFEADWERNLIPLLTQPNQVPFGDAWTTVREAVALVAKGPRG